MWVPFSGSKNETMFFNNWQVRTAWAWTRAILDRLGPEALLINLDETGVPVWMWDASGNILCQRTTDPQRGRDVTSHTTRHAMRAQVTHVELTCNDVEAQRGLPQIILGDSSTLTVGLQRELEASAPPHVRVWRQSSHWIDLAVLQALLRALAHVVRALSLPRTAVLLMDCCPIHLKPEVFRTARSLDIIIVLVPAKLTWLVQPLDAHVFNLYKKALRNKISNLRLQEASGQISVRQWWFALTERVREFMTSQPWASAFTRTGWDSTGDGVTSYLLRQLEWDTLPAIPATVPPVEHLRDILPRTRLQIAESLRRAAARLCTRAQPSLLAVRAASAAEASVPAAAEEWLIPRARPLLPPPPLPPPSLPPEDLMEEESLPRTSGAITAPMARAFIPPAEPTRSRTAPRPAGAAPLTSSPDAPISHRTRSRSFGPGTKSSSVSSAR